MTKQLLSGAPTERSLLRFFYLVFALSIPLSLAGTAVGLELLPGLPISSLVATCCPLITASILVYSRNGTAGVTGLLKRAFDIKRVQARIWYAPIVLRMSGAMILAYGLMWWMGSPIPVSQFAIWALPAMFVAFFLAALGEEWGRMGYAIDPLQPRLNALQASILPGLVWTAWQCLFRVTSRLLFVWLYDNTGKSVFTATVYHAILNITWQLFPINGS